MFQGGASETMVGGAIQLMANPDVETYQFVYRQLDAF
jgi:hypothetical protein